jgi:hypothetical protein
MSKVTFDGGNRLIIVNSGVTEIDIKADVYAAWKEWVIDADHAKWLPAMSAAGGDPTTAGRALGATFFMENGWKLRPYEGHHRLTITGNLYSRDGSDPFVNTVGAFNVRIVMAVSNLVDTVEGGGGGGGLTKSDVREAVWEAPSEFGTFGDLLNFLFCYRKNPMVTEPGNANNMVLYAQDGVTVLMRWSVTGPNGEPIIVPTGAASRRSNGTPGP